MAPSKGGKSLSRHAYQAWFSGIGQTPLCGLGFCRGRLGHGKRFAGGQKHGTLAAADAKVWKIPLPPHFAIIFLGKIQKPRFALNAPIKALSWNLAVLVPCFVWGVWANQIFLMLLMFKTVFTFSVKLPSKSKQCG